MLERETTRIRLVRDRGQWFIEVAGGDDWFSPLVWQAFLESSMPSVEIVPLDAQARCYLTISAKIEAIGPPPVWWTCRGPGSVWSGF